MFEKSRWRAPRALPTKQLTYLRSVLASHGNDPATGMCKVCGVSCCSDWRNAYDQLAVAGELMAEPDQQLGADVERGRSGAR